MSEQVKTEATDTDVLDEIIKETLVKQAQSSFITVPGQIYHVYRRSDGTTFVSMVHPGEWDMTRFKLEHVCPVVRGDDGTWEQAPVAQGIEQPPPKR